MVRLSDAQFGFLNRLANFGAATATQIIEPKSLDGTRKVRIEMDGTSAATLDKLSDAGLIHIERGAMTRPLSAVGKPGHRRVPMTITITDAGRAALE